MTHIVDMRVPCRVAGVSGIGGHILASLRRVQLWYVRSRQRDRLVRLDDRLLRDIGIDRIAAMQEASKPFWRD